VSHDRTFVNLVATEILEVKEGQALLFPDSYEVYVETLENQITQSSAPEKKQKLQPAAAPSEPARDQAKGKDHAERKAQGARLRKIENDLKKLEGDMQALEKEKAEIIAAFQTGAHAYSRERDQRLKDLEQILAQHEEKWLALQEDLQSLK